MKSLKRVGIYLSASPGCGGAYQYSHTMLQALSMLPKEKYQVCALYTQPSWAPLIQQWRVEGKFHKSPCFFWRALVGLWRRFNFSLLIWRKYVCRFHPLAKKMRSLHCDLWVFPSQDAYAYLMPVHALSTIHDLMHRYEARFAEVGAPKVVQAREFHYQQMCRFVSGLLVDSQLGKKQVIEAYAFPSEKCYVLPYVAPKGMTSSVFPEFDKKFLLPKKFLFYPAQFWEHKNHKKLLYAVANLLPELHDLQIVFVGSKKNGYEQVLRLIKSLALQSHVHLFGLVEDDAIPEFYRRARALIMPTFFGPTNIPPLEAFALRCPVAVSEVYAMKEQLGEAALYFDPERIDAITEVIKRLWVEDELCEALIKKGEQHHKNYQFKHFRLKVEKIIESVFNTF